MKDDLKANLTSGERWLRLLYMIMFAVIIHVTGAVMWLLVVLQFFFSLITGNDNSQLRELGRGIATYVFQILQFLSYNSEEKPFPFSDWPSKDD